MVQAALLVLLGLAAGTVSGVIGIGGGVLLVPALIFLFGLSQRTAQGTTLALMVPPIGLLAAWTYWKDGFVDLKIAGLVCVGFFIGGLLGAQLVPHVSDRVLERLFGVAMLLIGVKMIIAK